MKKKIFLCLISILIITGCGNKQNIEKPKKEEKQILLKENLSFGINEELKLLSLISENNDVEILSEDTLIDTSKLGEYEVTIKYKDNGVEKEQIVKISIIDAIPPSIEYKKELSTTEGATIDLLKDVKVTDNSKEEIKATVEGTYDFNKVGTYNLKYVAIDSSNNKIEEEFTLKVNAKPKLTLNKTYHDKNNMYRGSSLSEITLKSDGSVIASACAKEAGCSSYKGTYQINDKTLTVTLKTMEDITGEWITLPKYKKTTYNIVANDNFTYGNQNFVIK